MSELARSAPAGAQPERTALSWQRTALSCTAGAGIIARHTAPDLGPYVLLVFVATLALAVTAFGLGRKRYGLLPSETTRSRDGRAPIALALAISALAATELLATLLEVS